MPRTTKPPSYRKHKRSGQAVVTVGGRDHYLGPYGTKVSRDAYDRVIAEWLAGGRTSRSTPEAAAEITVTEVLAWFLHHAEGYYWGKDNRRSRELEHFKSVMAVLKRLYGQTPAVDFGPLRLKAARQQLIERGHGRKYVNCNTNRMRRIFKWAAENELVPPSVFQGLQTVSGLRRGHTEAPEGEPVRPVPDEHVDAIRPFVGRQVWAIVELQRLTGMRPGEVVIMRGRDLDTNGPVWLYRPENHKTEHHGIERVVDIGPKAQAIIRPFLKSDVEAFLFSPADAVAEKRAERHSKRKTPLSCGNRPGTNRKRRPKRTPREAYDTDAYRRAITRACKLAGVPHWHPHQLRHNYATRIRREFGVEAARILLGHRSAVVTELYAEIDRGHVRDIVAKVDSPVKTPGVLAGWRRNCYGILRDGVRSGVSSRDGLACFDARIRRGRSAR